MDCGRSVKQLWLQPNIPPQGCSWLKISSSASMAMLSHTQWWFVCPKSAGDHQEVVWIQSLSLLGHPPMTGWALCLAVTMPGSLAVAACWYSQLTYTCAYTCTHTYIYMHTYIYISKGPPAIRHPPTRHTVGASYSCSDLKIMKP